MGGNNEKERAASPESVPIHLKGKCLLLKQQILPFKSRLLKMYRTAQRPLQKFLSLEQEFSSMQCLPCLQRAEPENSTNTDAPNARKVIPVCLTFRKSQVRQKWQKIKVHHSP